jgi:hypothetical protein
LLTRESYARLKSTERAGTTYDAHHWTEWALDDFDAGYSRAVDDRPRRFVQIQARFSSGRDDGARLDHFQFGVSRPFVHATLAEIEPLQAVTGASTSFTYKIRLLFQPGDPGFDTIEIESLARFQAVNAVRVGGVARDFTVRRLDGEGLKVVIPRLDLQRSGELLEVDFRAQVFVFGTVFSGRIADSTQPREVSQALTPGDADPLNAGSGLKVALVNLGQRKLGRLEGLPPFFTPNGDGINDQMGIEYELWNLLGALPVELAVYDLSGRRRAIVAQSSGGAGLFQVTWDGRDEEGVLLPPGWYVLSLRVDTDSGAEKLQRSIGLAY